MMLVVEGSQGVSGPGVTDGGGGGSDPEELGPMIGASPVHAGLRLMQ